MNSMRHTLQNAYKNDMIFSKDILLMSVLIMISSNDYVFIKTHFITFYIEKCLFFKKFCLLKILINIFRDFYK